MTFTVPTLVGLNDPGNSSEVDAWTNVIALMNAANYGQLQGFKNRLRNGGFRVTQRTAASNADDTYTPLDRWYALTQTGSIAVSQQSNQEAGSINSIRLTQSQASAQRMGIAQIIEATNCIDLRGSSVAVSGRVRLSVSANVRYAVLEWTGTFDAVTSDVVNDWTSSTYTAGNFFNSTTLNVLAVGSVACTANTWRDITALTATVGASANNVIVVFWTEGTAAQNVTLDFNRLQLEPGVTATKFEALPYGTELTLCQTYFQKAGYGASGRATSSSAVVIGAPFVVRMRTNPTATLNMTNPNMRVNGVSSSAGSGSAIANGAASSEGWYMQLTGYSGLTAGDAIHGLTVGIFSFDAEL